MTETSRGIVVGEIVGEGPEARRPVRVGSWELAAWVGRGEEDQPRIRDLDLAERLGYERTGDIRKLIRRLEKDNGFGVLATVAQTSSSKGGRPGAEYWLTESQALEVAAASETANGKMILREMIEIFRMAVRGLLPGQSAHALRQIIEDIRAEFQQRFDAAVSDIKAELDVERAARRQLEVDMRDGLTEASRFIGEKLGAWVRGVIKEISWLECGEMATYKRHRAKLERELRNDFGFTARGSSWDRFEKAGFKYLENRLNGLKAVAFARSMARDLADRASQQMSFFDRDPNTEH